MKINLEDVCLLDHDNISWNSKKQTCEPSSAIEVRFVACLGETHELIWVKIVL